MNIVRKIFSLLVVMMLVSTIFVFRQTPAKADDPGFIEEIKTLNLQIGDILQIHSTENITSWKTSYWIGENIIENYNEYNLNVGIQLDEYWIETFLCIDNSSSDSLFIHSNASGVIISNSTEIWNGHNQLIDNWVQLRVNESFNPDDIVSFANDKLNRSYDNWSITHTTKQINVTNSSEDNYGYYDTELIWATFMNASSIDLDPDGFIDDNPRNFSWVTPFEIYNCSNITTIFIHDSENVTSPNGSYEDINLIVESSDINYVISDDLECNEFLVDLIAFPSRILYEIGIENTIATLLHANISNGYGGLYLYKFFFDDGSINFSRQTDSEDFEVTHEYNFSESQYVPIVNASEIYGENYDLDTYHLTVTGINIDHNTDWNELPPHPDVPAGLPDFDQRQDDAWKDSYGGELHWSYCQSCVAADALWWLDKKRENTAGPGSCNLIVNNTTVPGLIVEIRKLVNKCELLPVIPQYLQDGLNEYLENVSEDENYNVILEDFVFENLKDYIAEGDPVLLWIHSYNFDWGPFTHWVAVSGAGRDSSGGKYIRVSDPIIDISDHTDNYAAHNDRTEASHDLWKVTDARDLNDYSLFQKFPWIEGYTGRAMIWKMLIIEDITDNQLSINFNGYTSGLIGNSLPFTLNLTGGNETFNVYINFDDDGSNNSIVSIENTTQRDFLFNYTYTTPGTYNVVAAVRDDDGNGDVVEATQTITIVNSTYVELEASPNPSKLYRTIYFDATCFGNEGKEYYYEFIFGDSNTTYKWDTDCDGKVTANHYYTSDNVYNASVKVYNRSVLPRTLICESDVIEIHAYKFLVDACGPYYGWENEEIDFHGYADGIYGWIHSLWTFGDGNFSQDFYPSHTYASGSYNGIVYPVNFSVECDDITHYNLTNATVYSGTKEYPTADITANPACGALPGQNVTFDASGSSDQGNGSIIQYDYKMGFDPWIIDQGSSYTHSFKYSSKYNVQVRVHDNHHLIDIAELNYTVTKISAYFYCSPSSPTDIQNVTFHDTSSPDPCETVNYWHWTFGDGDASTDQNPEHQYDDDGYYFVKLKVKDTGNNERTMYKGLYVRNVPPVSQYTNSRLVTVVDENISFNSTSYDLDGEIINWSWNYGDLTTSNIVNNTHNYSDSGFYTVKLRVKDDDYDRKTRTKENHLLIADAIVSEDFNESSSGWGVTRFDDFQDGIDAVPSNGTLVVLDGTYGDSTGYTINKTMDIYGVKKGDGQGDTEIQYGGVEITYFDSAPLLINITAPNVYIKGFTVSGAEGIRVNSDNTTIDNCTFLNNQVGVVLLNDSNTSIQNCNFSLNTMGLLFNQSNNSRINDSKISQNDLGIKVIDCSENNSITECNITDNDIGIKFEESSNVHISYCLIRANEEIGVHLEDSMENKISDSDIETNEIGVYIENCTGSKYISNNLYRCDISNNNYGVYLYNSSFNEIGEDTTAFHPRYNCKGNNISVYLNQSDLNTISDFFINATKVTPSSPEPPTIGVYFDDSDRNTIINTIITCADKFGIIFANSSKNTIYQSRITENNHSILIDNTSSSIVKNCSIDNNTDYGIIIKGGRDFSRNNRIYYNDFILNGGEGELENKSQGYSDVDNDNFWDDQVKPSPTSGLGNYWGNYEGEDANEDGIGDTPYAIDGDGRNQDRFPSMEPFGWED